MCGIIGYVGADAAVIRARLDSSRDTMLHRGPDDAGSWTASGVCLGSRRLSVLDLSQTGHMPMASEDEQLALVYNGEIYNFVELRSELQRSVRFRSTGDTEVILNGYRIWGWSGLLNRLDGMFAFALWDVQQQRLYAARDRVGEKPFFHTRIGDGFAFASTLGALTALKRGPVRVDSRALDAYLTYQAVPAPMAMLEGFRQLAPAHELTFDADLHQLDVRRYWDLRFAPKHALTESECVDAIDGLLRKSVQQRLRSDVPTGTLLSGGVDSSIITAIVSQQSEAPTDAVTLGYTGAIADERPYARVVAEKHGVRLHEEVLTPNVVRDLPRIVWEYGQPLADVSIVPNYYLAAAARRFMTVALVGDGADEAFGGYARPVIERIAPLYRKVVPSLLRKGLASAFAELPGTRSANPLRRRMALLTAAGSVSARENFIYERGFRTLRGAAYAPPLMSTVRDWNPDALYAESWDRAVGEDDVDRALYGDFVTYLPDQLLAKADVSSMAFGLETRSPFLSRDIIEFAALIQTSLRLRKLETKYLLKRVAERYVPHDVIYRPKRGFVIPAAQWLRGELAPYVVGILDSASFLDRGWIQPVMVRSLLAQHVDGSRDWSNQLWTLLVLEIWARLVLDGSATANDTLDDMIRA